MCLSARASRSTICPDKIRKSSVFHYKNRDPLAYRISRSDHGKIRHLIAFWISVKASSSDLWPRYPKKHDINKRMTIISLRVMRICWVCKQDDTTVIFTPKSQKICKSCKADKSKLYREANRLKINETNKKIYEERKEDLKRKYKEYRLSHRDEVNLKKRIHYEKNREIIKAKTAQYGSSAAGIEKRSMRDKKRRENDSIYTLRVSLRSRFKRAISGKYKKPSSILELIGCSLQEFRDYIEKQWDKNMTWGNYGFMKTSWQLDHIKPVAAFDLSNPLELESCFHFSNVQPLWKSENASKGSKWDEMHDFLWTFRNFIY